MMKKMKSAREGNQRPTVQAERDAMAFFQRFLELDPAVMPHLIDEIRGWQDITDDEKREVIMISFMSLAQNSPERALDLNCSAPSMPSSRRARQEVMVRKIPASTFVSDCSG